MAAERKRILLRLDPAVHDALARWASDELRSTNAQIEFLLRAALRDAGRMPADAGRMRRPGRPAKAAANGADGADGAEPPPGRPAPDAMHHEGPPEEARRHHEE